MNDLLARLIADGTSAELVAEVAMLLAEKKLLDERRSNDRQRKQAQRDRERNEDHVTSRDVTGQDVTPSLSLPPNENNSNPPTHTHPDNTPARKGKTGTPAKPDDVQDQTWADFLDLRKKKRAPLTATALAGIVREAEMAGWPLERALSETVTRGWQSFKAEFVQSRGPPATPFRPRETEEERLKRERREYVRKKYGAEA